VLIVVNRYSNDQKELLVETENMLGVRMAGLIPNDYETASEALHHGKPLAVMAPRTAIGQWYTRESQQLIDDGGTGNRKAAGSKASQTTSFLGRYLPSLGFEAKGKPSAV
jgi:hypothetical protein